MKSRIQSLMLACVALTGAFFASCTDDALMEASENHADHPFELTVQQPSNGSRLALDNDGLTTNWEPGDQLVLVNKAGGKAPIYLTCTLAQNASSAKFVSESGVHSGEYYVIYNYNEDMTYGHKCFMTIEDINEYDELVLWGELNIPANTYSANVNLEHLYAKIKFELRNIPNGETDFEIGVCSSKGFPKHLLFTNAGLVNAEWGVDFNSLCESGDLYEYKFIPSNSKYHNIKFGQYSAEYNGSSYNWSRAMSLSALVLPADMTGEDLFFYVRSGTPYNSTCYEIKKIGGVNFKAGTNYNIQLDLNKATVTTLTENQGYIEIANAAEWRHASYCDSKGLYKLTADIDFDNECFFPIDCYDLEGNDKKLSNINLDWSDEDNVGLIKSDACSTSGDYDRVFVSNLTLENIIVKGKNYVGAFGGKNIVADKCSVIGNSVVSGQEYVGGISGCNGLDEKQMDDVRVGQSCSISGKNYVGGIVGRCMDDSNESTIYLHSSRTLLKSCKSEATVTATGDYVGGIFGKIGGDVNSAYSSIRMNNYQENYTLSVEKCINEGNVTGVNYVGGIGGDFAVSCYDKTVVDRVVLKESYSEGNVSGTQKVAGILGATRAAVNTCYSIGTIAASTTEVGGIVGRIEDDGMESVSRVVNSYSMATLTVGTNGYIGGIVGNAGGGMYGGKTIINCYYAADPNAYSFGGIVGNSDGYCQVTNCVTTLASLGNNLGNHQISTDYNNDGYPDGDYNNDGMVDSNDLWVNANDIITNSKNSVTSILAEHGIINADQKYSTNVWSGYSWNCVKFASFEVDTDSDDYDDETVIP